MLTAHMWALISRIEPQDTWSPYWEALTVDRTIARLNTAVARDACCEAHPFLGALYDAVASSERPGHYYLPIAIAHVVSVAARTGLLTPPRPEGRGFLV